jgi:hypothetical protein
MLWVDVPYPHSLDALADALRRDPVIVQQLVGGGDAAGVDRRLTQLVGKLPFKAYVALVDTPAADADQQNDQMATAISRRIAEPGLYIVATPDGGPLGLRLVGTGWNQTEFDLQQFANTDAVEAAVAAKESQQSWYLSAPVDAETVLETALVGQPTDPTTPDLSARTLSDLVDHELALQPYERASTDGEDPPEPWSTGKRWMVGTAVGAGALLLLVIHLLWGWWPGWRRRVAGVVVPSKNVEPAISEVRTLASDQLTALATALPGTPGGTHQDAALLAREVAEPLLGSDRLYDVVGALVLARFGLREVERASDRTKPVYHPCFFNPLHGAGNHAHEWEFGDTTVAVPICTRCASGLEHEQRPAVLGQRRLGGFHPYYTTDTIWARTGFGALVDDLPHQVGAARRETS